MKDKRNERSMEEGAPAALTGAQREDAPSSGSLADAIRARFRRLGGVELAVPAREPIREPPKPRR